MKTIAWTSDMSVGVKEIDDQHKQFIQIMADFYTAFGENKAQLEMESILNRLIEYAILHFETEEKYFDKFNYEFKDEHKKEHAELEEKVLVFQERFQKEGTGIVAEFMDFLIDWLVNHLEAQDQKYVKCFHDNGLV